MLKMLHSLLLSLQFLREMPGKIAEWFRWGNGNNNNNHVSLTPMQKQAVNSFNGCSSIADIVTAIEHEDIFAVGAVCLFLSILIRSDTI